MINYKIHFIRHCFTKENIENTYIAKNIDTDIDNKSIELINQYKNKYEYPPIDKAFSSPKKRCINTIKCIYDNILIETIDGFDDLDIGCFEGKSILQLKDDTDYLNWMKDIRNTPNGGEKFSDFEKRIDVSLNYMVNNIMKYKIISSLLCTHSMVLMNILSRYCLPKTSPIFWNIGYLKGITVYFNTSLWGHSKLFEVSGIIPYGCDKFN